LTRAVAWFVTRASFVLVPAWIVAAVAAAHYLPPISGGIDSPLGGLVPGGAGAISTEVREFRRFRTTLLTRVVVVQHEPRKLTRRQIRLTLRVALRVDTKRAPLLGHIVFAAPLVSRDRTTTVTYLYFAPRISTEARLALADTYSKRLSPHGLVTGALPARVEEFDHIESSLPKVTYATLALIVLVLLVTFRALAPPLIVLGAAAVAYTTSVHLLAWLAQQQGRTVPKEVEPVLVALLLGLVTDYALFFLARTRKHLQDGAGRIHAAESAARENLPIVVTAGLIVTLGSLTLLAGRLDVFRSFGPGMALGVLVTLAVAVTFVPGVLALLGRLAYWPTFDRAEREPNERVWRLATRRPVSALTVLAVAVGLAVVASQVRHLHLGFTLIRGQPADSEVKRGAEDADRGFAAGIVAPTELLLEGRRLGGRRTSLRHLQRLLERQPRVALVVGPREQPRRHDLPLFIAPDGGAARYAVVLREEPLSAPAIDALQGLRARMPTLLDESGLAGTHVSYAGDTALAEETVDAIRRDGVRVGIAVLLVNFVLLAVFLRALAAPLYLLAASLLALGAALGATTWTMETALGHDDLTYYVPFAASVLLLSLGSDYNVFVVGRIWQEARTRPLREAIVFAAPRASATITVAGVTLAGTFALLALIPIRPMRELAFAMAVGILLDTFVVRSLLVPSLLALFARASSDGNRRNSGDGERPLHR
jgi:RND superfamily putative drug exporter